MSRIAKPRTGPGERLLVIPGWEGGVDPEDGSALVHAIIQSQLRLVAEERTRIRAAVERMPVYDSEQHVELEYDIPVSRKEVLGLLA